MKKYESPELLLKVYTLNMTVANNVSEVEDGEIGVDGGTMDW